MQFFNECTNAVDLRRAYRRLVREHHPDRGGDVVTFRAVQEDYEAAKVKVLGIAGVVELNPGPMPAEQPEASAGVVSTHRACPVFGDCNGTHQDVSGYRLHLLPSRPFANQPIGKNRMVSVRVGIRPAPGGPERLPGQGGATLSDWSRGVQFHDGAHLPHEVREAVATLLGGALAAELLPRKRSKKQAAG